MGHTFDFMDADGNVTESLDPKTMWLMGEDGLITRECQFKFSDSEEWMPIHMLKGCRINTGEPEPEIHMTNKSAVNMLAEVAWRIM